MAGSKQRSVLAGGVYAALATPRRADSIEADAAALLEYLDAVSAGGVDGFVLFGATGEFVHFTPDERMRVASLALKRSRAPVLINVSHSTLPGAFDIAESAIGAGASGLLLAPPHFYRYPENQIFEFYRRFAESVNGEAPVYLYNLPAFLNPLSPGLAVRLLETGWFAGIKDSSGDWSTFEVLLALKEKSPFRLLIGNEAIYQRARPAGADGSISGVAGAVPELVVALDRAIVASDQDRAEKLNRRLLEFLDRAHTLPAPVAIRQACVARGWPLKHLAVPFDEDQAADVIAFQAWFRHWLAEVQAECGQRAA